MMAEKASKQLVFVVARLGEEYRYTHRRKEARQEEEHKKIEKTEEMNREKKRKEEEHKMQERP